MIDTASGSALAGAGGLGLALVAHVVRYAYDKGQTDNRLAVVEKNTSAQGEVHSVLSALTATVGALKESVERLDRALERINGRVFPAERAARDA